jgi:hypothetical protein
LCPPTVAMAVAEQYPSGNDDSVCIFKLSRPLADVNDVQVTTANAIVVKQRNTLFLELIVFIASPLPYNIGG